MKLCSVGNQSKNSLSLRCLSNMSLSYTADDFLGSNVNAKTLVFISGAGSNFSASFPGSLIFPSRSLRDGGKMTEVANL